MKDLGLYLNKKGCKLQTYKHMAKAVKKVTKAVKEVKVVKQTKTLKEILSKFDIKLSPEQMKEKILMLRTDMSQAINLSTSTSILALLLFIGAPSVFPEIINPYLPSSLKIMQAIVIVPSFFWILTILGNMAKFVMIVRLQKKLSSK